jgi:hypothetical protein
MAHHSYEIKIINVRNMTLLLGTHVSVKRKKKHLFISIYPTFAIMDIEGKK